MVSSAEVSTLDKVELSLYVGGVNSVAAEPVTSNNCDVKLKAVTRVCGVRVLMSSLLSLAIVIF